MKITKGILLSTSIAFAVIMTAGCKKDETPDPASTVYEIQVKDQLGVSGTVTFTETSATVTTIDIALVGADSESHPTHIHLNSAVEGGAIALSLNPVVNGYSSTQVTMLDNNSSINYSQLIVYNGYINVHQSSIDIGTIIGQTDIGGNALTSTSKNYNLDVANASGVAGTALFQKRKNGKALVTISLTGTLAGGTHPAIIHIGSVETVGGGPAVKTLNPVDGATGKSYTNLLVLDDQTPVTYDNMLVYDGYLAIHESALLMGSVICQGNIGTN
jgi:hypothetical protein